MHFSKACTFQVVSVIHYNSASLCSLLQIHSRLGNSYFLHSDPDLSGSPPRRAPPTVHVKQNINQASCSSKETDPLNEDDAKTAGDDYGFSCGATAVTHPKPVEHVEIPSLGLPDLHTGTGPLLFFIFSFSRWG